MNSISLVATTTWNSADVVRTFVTHYLKLGFERLLVMDFQSTDGTREVLTDEQWRGLVDLVPFPGLAGLDSSNLLLPLARERYGPDAWCLFCDPDELLVVPGMAIENAIPRLLSPNTDAFELPRFNVTAPRSIARSSEARLTPLDALTLRIERRHEREPGRDLQADVLVPPWIFTAIGGKVFVHLGRTASIGEGDHHAVTSGGTFGRCPQEMYLLHYPFWSYSDFCKKFERARTDFAANLHLSQAHGWQVRRWIALADAGLLQQECLDQFIADDEKSTRWFAWAQLLWTGASHSFCSAPDPSRLARLAPDSAPACTASRMTCSSPGPCVSIWI